MRRRRPWHLRQESAPISWLRRSRWAQLAVDRVISRAPSTVCQQALRPCGREGSAHAQAPAGRACRASSGARARRSRRRGPAREGSRGCGCGSPSSRTKPAGIFVVATSIATTPPSFSTPAGKPATSALASPGAGVKCRRAWPVNGTVAHIGSCGGPMDHFVGLRVATLVGPFAALIISAGCGGSAPQSATTTPNDEPRGQGGVADDGAPGRSGPAERAYAPDTNTEAVAAAARRDVCGQVGPCCQAFYAARGLSVDRVSTTCSQMVAPHSQVTGEIRDQMCTTQMRSFATAGGDVPLPVECE